MYSDPVTRTVREGVVVGADSAVPEPDEDMNEWNECATGRERTTPTGSILTSAETARDDSWRDGEWLESSQWLLDDAVMLRD